MREIRLEKIEAAKKALEEEAKGGAVDQKAQKSFNDLEAMPMAKVGHEFKYGYNVQAAVDEQSQMSNRFLVISKATRVCEYS